MSSHRVTEVARDRFGLEVDSAVLISDGWNDIWKINAANSVWVVRVSGDEVAPESVAYEHRLLAQLSGNLPWVVAPSPDADGETFHVDRGRCYSLFPFIAGEPPSPADAETRSRIASQLGALHAVCSRLPDEDRPGYQESRRLPWGWYVAKPTLESRVPVSLVDELHSAARDLAAWGASLENGNLKGGRGPVHGDFKPANMLAASGEVVGIIDWDFAHPDWFAWELGWAIATLTQRADGSSPGDQDFRLRAGVDFGQMDAFIRDYQIGGGTVNPDLREFVAGFLSITAVNELALVVGEPAPAEPEGVAHGIRDTVRELGSLGL